MAQATGVYNLRQNNKNLTVDKDGVVQFKDIDDSNLGQFWLVKPLNTAKENNTFILISLLLGKVLTSFNVENYNGRLIQILIDRERSTVDGNGTAVPFTIVKNPMFLYDL